MKIQADMARAVVATPKASALSQQDLMKENRNIQGMLVQHTEDVIAAGPAAGEYFAPRVLRNAHPETAWRAQLLIAGLSVGRSISQLTAQALAVHFRHPDPDYTGAKIVGRSQMSAMLPFVSQLLHARNLGRVSGIHLSFLFDGLFSHGACLLLIARTVNPLMEVRQLMASMPIMVKHERGQDVSAHIVATANKLNISALSPLIVATMHDSAAVSLTAMVTLQPNFPICSDSCCLSHAISNTGGKYACDQLSQLLEAVCGLMRSQAAVEYKRMYPNDKIVPTSTKRWWSWYEAAVLMFNQLEHILAFIAQTDSESAYFQRLQVMLAEVGDNTTLVYAKVQLATAYDTDMELVKQTYILESDVPMAWRAQESIGILRRQVALLLDSTDADIKALLPQAMQTIAALAPDDADRQQALFIVAKSTFKPAFEYLRKTVFAPESRHARQLAVFAPAQVLNPLIARTLAPGAIRGPPTDETACTNPSAFRG